LAGKLEMNKWFDYFVPFCALQAQNVSKRAEALKIQIGPSFFKQMIPVNSPPLKNKTSKKGKISFDLKFLQTYSSGKSLRVTK
jgi:5,10-methylenetetrahydrofolate reductase